MAQNGIFHFTLQPTYKARIRCGEEVLTTIKERKSYGTHQQDRAPGTRRYSTHQRAQRNEGSQLFACYRSALQDTRWSCGFRDHMAQRSRMGKQGHSGCIQHQRGHAAACPRQTEDIKIHKCRRHREDLLRSSGQQDQSRAGGLLAGIVPTPETRNVRNRA